MKIENLTKDELFAKYKQLIADTREEKRLERQIDREFQKLYKENFPDEEIGFKDRLYFYLQHRKRLRKTRFDIIIKNLTDIDGFIYDVVAHNPVNAVVIKVVQTASYNDVVDLIENTIPRFKSYHNHLLTNTEVYGALASEKLTNAQAGEIEKEGLFAITKKRNGIKILNKPGFKPKAL